MKALMFIYFVLQIGLKITENKKLKRKLDTTKVEKETLQQDLDLASQEKSQLQSTLDQWKQSQLGEQSKVTELETENKLLHRELERVNRELADNMAREPVLQEQIQVVIFCGTFWTSLVKNFEYSGSG